MQRKSSIMLSGIFEYQFMQRLLLVEDGSQPTQAELMPSIIV